MYHHIRNYADTTDTIGFNLSVTPERFKQQLDLIQSRGYTAITFADLANPNLPAKPIILTFDDGYQNFYDNAWPELKSHNMSAVSYVIVNERGGDYMTAPEIKTISAAGIEIGSHTLSHPNLTKISANKVATELTESKASLESLLGRKVISFCYPTGKYNLEIENIVQSNGYEYAVTTNNSLAKFGDDNFALSRYRVNADTNIVGFLK